MKLFGLLLVILAAALPFLIAAPSNPPAPLAKPAPIILDGIYHATGNLTKGTVNEKGEITDKKYRSVVMLKKHKSIYTVNWIDGGVGVGFVEGDSLTVAFQRNGNDLSAARYRIEVGKDGKPKLLGKWVGNPGNGEQHSEDLTFLKALEE